jgi:hypothetical protein
MASPSRWEATADGRYGEYQYTGREGDDSRDFGAGGWKGIKKMGIARM